MVKSASLNYCRLELLSFDSSSVVRNARLATAPDRKCDGYKKDQLPVLVSWYGIWSLQAPGMKGTTDSQVVSQGFQEEIILDCMHHRR